MRILYLMNYAGEGGSETYVENLAAALWGANQIHFIYHLPGKLVGVMEALGAAVFRLDMPSPFDRKAVAALTAYVDKHGIEVIHTQFPRENYLALLVKRRRKAVKVIYTSHIITEDTFIKKQLNKHFLKRNDAVIALCARNIDALVRNGYPKHLIHRIYNGVPLPTDSGGDNLAVRNEFGIERGCFVFITATRFTPEKGVPFLLEAAEALTKRLRFRLIIAGDGPDRAEMEALATAKGLADTVHFAGYRNDMPALLSASDCFLNSSANENISFAILEAMAHGLPIIATNVGGNSEILSEESDCGLLAGYGDAAGYAAAMERMITDTDLLRRCGQNTVNAIKTRFSIDMTIASTYNLYKGDSKGDTA